MTKQTLGLIFGVAVGVVFIDQVTKFMAITSNISFINTGISFGWGEANILSLIFSIIALGAVLYLGQKWWLKAPLSLSLILGGSISNIIDRLFRGGVVDWIPIFNNLHNNLADIAISLGLIWLLILIFKTEHLDNGQTKG